MKGVDIAPQALFWMGKRRDRDDVHIVDTFFTNMSGVGAGVENIDVGFGKFGFAGYKADTPAVEVDGVLNTTAGNNGVGRIHAQLYDIPVNPDGKLRLVATLSKGDSQGGTKGQSGYGFNVEHVQDKFFGGGNHIWVQYAEGSTDINQGISDNGAHGSGYKVWRIVESPSWQIGAFGGQAIAMYQHNKAPDTAAPVSTLSTAVSSNYWTDRRPRLVGHHQEPEVADGNRLLQPEAGRRRVGERHQGHHRPGAVDRPGLLEAPGAAPVRDLRGLQQGRRRRLQQQLRLRVEQDQRRVLRRPGRDLVLILV
jgi:maltoporin